MDKAKLTLYSGLFLILSVGLIFIIGTLTGKIFYLELLGLLFLLVLIIIGYASYARWGERVFFLIFFFYLANIVLLWYYLGQIYLVLLFLSFIGFFMALPQKKVLIKKPVEPYSQVFEPKEPAKSTVSFTPGKYVASKMGNTYHEPKCEWAKKIAKSRRVWFTSKDEAWEKKYKAHSCVQ